MLLSIIGYNLIPYFFLLFGSVQPSLPSFIWLFISSLSSLILAVLPILWPRPLHSLPPPPPLFLSLKPLSPLLFRSFNLFGSLHRLYHVLFLYFSFFLVHVLFAPILLFFFSLLFVSSSGLLIFLFHHLFLFSYSCCSFSSLSTPSSFPSSSSFSSFSASLSSLIQVF